jgi:hypothetical protein
MSIFMGSFYSTACPGNRQLAINRADLPGQASQRDVAVVPAADGRASERFRQAAAWRRMPVFAGALSAG